MRGDPLTDREIVLQHSAAGGTMTRLADKPKLQLRTPVASDRKAHSVEGAFFGKAGTAGSVAKIAKLPHFLIRRFDAFMSGSATMSGPSSAQRQP